jgi:hypothetical protein
VKSEKASGDPRTPDLDFALPPELTELVSEATQHEIRSEVLQIHAKLLNHDPEFKDCGDNGRHLQALFDILASKLSDRPDFDKLLDVSIPAMVAAIKNALGWKWPGGNAEMLKKAYLLGSILKWHLKARAMKSGSQPEEQGDRVGSASRVAVPDASEHASRRQAVVNPILNSRGWTTNKWGTLAGVGKSCPYDYLSGKRKLTDPNRKALADVLELKPEDLPN